MLFNKFTTSLVIIIIRIYRFFSTNRFLSYLGFVSSGCRFIPTCSIYAIEAFECHGFWKGGDLTLRRICCCHPFYRMGGGSHLLSR